MFKKRFITLCLCWSSLTCFSQSISQQVLGNGGGSGMVNGYQIDYNIGEMAIQTAGSAPFLTEGFEQPDMGAIPLPVRGLTLQVLNKNGRAQLHFSTIQELNTGHFIVERSANAITFDTLTIIKTKALNGYSTQPLQYTYTDPRKPASVVYYRIVQVDLDGNYQYSGVKPFNVNAQGTVKLFPNPATAQIRVQLGHPPAAKTTIRIYSFKGVLKYSEILTGKSSAIIGLNGWPAGIYLLVADSGGRTQTIKFIKR